ncbi:hypothetical protein NXY55_22765, partial [Aeromonas veronii]|nr:hypothetical protein [Aeromonas veronii]
MLELVVIAKEQTMVVVHLVVLLPVPGQVYRMVAHLQVLGLVVRMVVPSNLRQMAGRMIPSVFHIRNNFLNQCGMVVDRLGRNNTSF